MKPNVLHLELPPVRSDASLALNDLEARVERARHVSVDEGLQQILGRLFICNRSDLPVLERQRVLHLFSAQYSHYQQQLQAKHATSARLIDLCTELAYGYKRLLQQIALSRSSNRPHLSWALYTALYFLAQQLLRNVEIYRQVPAWLWHDAHTLLRCAEMWKCVDTQVMCPLQPQACDTVRGLHMQMLLLALSNPYHLPAGQCLRLFDALTEYAMRANLVLWRPNDSTEAIVVDLNGEQPYLPAQSIPERPALYIRRLELSALLLLIQNAGKTTADPHLSTLAKVQNHWQRQQARRHSREQALKPCRVAIGLEPIHQHLLGVNDNLYSAQVLDISHGGARLSCDLALQTQLDVGQLVLIELTDRAVLALVRWCYCAEEGLLIGVRQLRGQPCPLWLRRAPAEQAHRALLQRPNKAPSRPAPNNLWLPKGHFSNGETLWLQPADQSTTQVIELPPPTLKTAFFNGHPLRLPQAPSAQVPVRPTN